MGLKDKFNDKFPKRARPKKNVSKENWEYLDNQDVSDKSTYRDVYYDQDFKRGDLTHVPTFDSRRNIIIVLSVLLFITVYFGYLRVDAFVYDHFKDPTPQVENYRPDKKYYWVESDKLNGKTVYYAKDDPNNLDYKSIEERKTYAKKEQVPKPSWYLELEKQYKKLYTKKKPEIDAYNKKLAKKQKAFSFNLVGLLLASASSAILAGALYPLFKRNYEAQTVLYRTDDINQFKNDQHIMLPEEILQYKDFDIFPDAGCVSSVSPNALISHFAIKNKGLNKTMFTVRHKADVIDEETGEVIAYKGEPVRNEDGSIQQTKVDLIDEKFGDALFEASGQPKDVRGFFDISSTDYNSSGTRRERLGKFKTISEMINKDWELPWYEPQRPAGFYMVDVTPTNTMVLAITRAGKGQTYIEPLIDMWLREREPNNIVINDPKGELLVKFYVPATVRNFEVVQFNLINPMKTNIYNPLALASEAARQGDNVKCSAYVENIAQVFFPVDGGDDPVWANSANNAVRDVA